MQTFAQSIAATRCWLRQARVACVGALFASVCAASLAESPREITPVEVEAAYLYNFGKFVSWPPQQDSISVPFVICAIGKDDFANALDSLTANEEIQGRKILVKRLPAITASDVCQIAFLGASEQSRLAKDLEALKDRPTLTVSSLPGFLERGGMIQFMVQNERVRFAVNLQPAARSHLALSSELLKVAVYVNGKPPGEAP